MQENTQSEIKIDDTLEFTMDIVEERDSAKNDVHVTCE